MRERPRRLSEDHGYPSVDSGASGRLRGGCAGCSSTAGVSRTICKFAEGSTSLRVDLKRPEEGSQPIPVSGLALGSLPFIALSPSSLPTFNEVFQGARGGATLRSGGCLRLSCLRPVSVFMNQCRRLRQSRPTNPNPSSAMLAGSGTVAARKFTASKPSISAPFRSGAGGGLRI